MSKSFLGKKRKKTFQMEVFYVQKQEALCLGLSENYSEAESWYTWAGVTRNNVRYGQIVINSTRYNGKAVPQK